MKNQRLLPFILPLLLIVINLVVKGLFLGSNSLGGDEPFSVYHAQMSPSAIVQQLSLGNNPPLYELLLHYWIKLFGISEFAVRFPSLIFSAVTVYFICRIGQSFFNQRVAIYASLFFIFSNYHILFAHEARAYALMGMLTAISMYCYLNLITERNTGTGNRVTLLIVNVLLMYTHYFGFFVLLLQFLFVVIKRDLLRKHYKFLGLAILASLLAFSPFLTVVIGRFSSSASAGTWVKAPNGMDDFYEMFRTFANAPVTAVFTIAILLIGGILLAIRKSSGTQRVQTQFVLLWFYLPFLFMFAVSFRVPMFLDRYLMVAAIGFVLTLAVSADQLIRSEKWKYVLPGVLCLLFIVTVKPNKTNKREVRKVVELVKTQQDENTYVIVSPYHFSMNFAYYFDRKSFTDYSSADPYGPILRTLKEQRVWCVDGIVGFDASKWKRVIFVDAASQFSAPNNGIFETLNGSYQLVNKQHVEEIFDVYMFERK